MTTPFSRFILFVCTGNTCRSPLAEGLFHQAASGHPEWIAESAGIAASDGYPASPETMHALQQYGVHTFPHHSTRLTEKQMDLATDIFVMTSAHMAILLANFPEHADKIHLVTQYTDGQDIDDPIGYGQSAYDSVCRSLSLAIDAMIDEWERNTPPPTAPSSGN